MQTVFSETKVVTAVMSSGSTTSSGVNVAGYSIATLRIPVLTSALLTLLVQGTGVTMLPFYDPAAGAVRTLATPVGTGGVAIGSNDLTYIAGHNGPVYVSAAAAQAADRNFVWTFKS